MEIIKCENLKKIYKLGIQEVIALDNISFSVSKGEFVLVMGASGSGKSTLLNLISGLDRPTSGRIIIEKEDISNFSDTQITLLRRKKIGFIFQFFNLLPNLTAKENVILPYLIEGKKNNYDEEIKKIFELVGLDKKYHNKPDELSGGEQQKVAIARALIKNPAIVLADEPTGNLDSKTSIEIFNILRCSCNSLSQTILLVSHNPVSLKFCDRCIFLKDGKIIGEENLKGKVVDEELISNLIKKYSP